MCEEKIVAISYAHGSEEYNNKVETFVNQLRTAGYNATFDVILQQEQTARDFNEMMDSLITKADKVIVVLSKEYKNKADNREGGVGAEYRIIQNEIDIKTKKYIFVTFEKLNKLDPKSLIPSALGNREVLEIPEDIKNFNKLLAKLNDMQITVFESVAKEKILPQQKIVPTKYNNKAEIFKTISVLLYENETIYNQFGPECQTAIKNPLSESVNDWKSKKINNIIPNNKKIIELFETNIGMFSQEEIRKFQLFKVHAEAFEERQEGRIGAESVPLFPLEFKDMICPKEGKQ